MKTQIRAAGQLVFASEGRTMFQLRGGQVQLQAADGATKLRRFTMLAYDGGLLRLPNIPHPVVVDLEGLEVPSQTLPILRDHDIGRVVAHSETIEVTASAINAAGVMSGTGEAAQEVLATASNGFPWQASIGADATQMELFQAGERVTVNGRAFTGPLYVARNAELKEISFVSLGAARRTSAKIAAKGGNSMKTFEEWCAEKGHDLTNATDEQKAAWKAEYEKELGTPVQAGYDAVKAMREQAAKEAQRIADVTRIAAEHPEIRVKAIAEGWEPLKVENAVLRASRPSGGPYFSIGTTQRDVTDDVLQAALCIEAKLGNPDKHFKPEVLDIAAKHCSGWGLQAVILHHARKNGYQGESLAAFRGRNHGHVIRAAFSTNDLPNLLSQTAERFAMEGLAGNIGTQWRLFSRIKTVNDFKPTKGISLVEANEYEEIAPDGEIKHGSLNESTWTNRAKSFGKMLAITYQDQRNDDLGFLSDANALLGRGADRKINKEWWTEFMDNSAFFTSGRANYAEGSGTALSAAALATFEALFMAQTTEDGDDVGFMPRYLLVPPALGATARELYSSRTWNTGGAASTEKVAADNIWAGKFEPVVAPQLGNSAYTGYSSTAFYLLADPKDAAVMEVVFLDGKETPTIETAEADFSTLGIQMRGHIHFGVKLAEYRAGVKSKGAA